MIAAIVDVEISLNALLWLLPSLTDKFFSYQNDREGRRYHTIEAKQKKKGKGASCKKEMTEWLTQLIWNWSWKQMNDVVILVERDTDR